MERGHAWNDEPPSIGDNGLLQQEGGSPRPPVFMENQGTDAACHLPFLETNWEVTPASKVAKTGLWSLVMMSLVLPAGEGRHF